jgi:catechol 2,3-dioxygenase-like lactoylglutathione lyase family enzyme
MSTTSLTSVPAPDTSNVGSIAMRFENTRLPVADLDRAKAFYQRLGWRMDIDFSPDGEHRGIQFTPPGSQASIQFSDLPTGMTPLDGMLLVVDDIDAARADLIDRGVDVSEVFHIEIGKGVVPGHDPQNQSYANRAAFSDPDGNQWQLQQITERLPGRVE